MTQLSRWPCARYVRIVWNARDLSLREIARVLKPGGVAVISDLALTEASVHGLTKLGLAATRSAIVFDTFPFQCIVTALRPLAR